MGTPKQDLEEMPFLPFCVQNNASPNPWDKLGATAILYLLQKNKRWLSLLSSKTPQMASISTF